MSKKNQLHLVVDNSGHKPGDLWSLMFDHMLGNMLLAITLTTEWTACGYRLAAAEYCWID